MLNFWLWEFFRPHKKFGQYIYMYIVHILQRAIPCFAFTFYWAFLDFFLYYIIAYTQLKSIPKIYTLCTWFTYTLKIYYIITIQKNISSTQHSYTQLRAFDKYNRKISFRSALWGIIYSNAHYQYEKLHDKKNQKFEAKKKINTNFQ